MQSFSNFGGWIAKKGLRKEKRQSMETAGSYHHSKPCVLGKKINPSPDPQFTPVHLQFWKQEWMPWNLAVAGLPKPTNLAMKLITFYLLHLTNYHGEISFKSSWRWNCLTQLTACFDIIHLQVLPKCFFLWCKLSAAKPYKFSNLLHQKIRKPRVEEPADS